MLMWGVESRDLQSLQLAARFPGYESWTVVASHQPDLLLTNAMALIESSPSDVPRLPPRLHLDPRRAATAPGALGTPAAVGGAAPGQPPATGKAARSTAGNGRRHRKKEFQLQPSRARCEVRRSGPCKHDKKPLIFILMGGSVAEWLACWTQAQKGPGSNRSRDAVG